MVSGKLWGVLLTDLYITGLETHIWLAVFGWSRRERRSENITSQTYCDVNAYVRFAIHAPPKTRSGQIQPTEVLAAILLQSRNSASLVTPILTWAT